MPDVALVAAPPRGQLIERLRPRLGELAPGLQLIAEDLLGADSRIDFVGVEPTGRIVLILMAEAGEDLALIGRALAQRAWVEPRIRDWIQLAPGIGARPAAGVRALLLCPEYSAQTVAAAAALGADAVSLARFRCLQNGAELQILLEPVDRSPDPAIETGVVPAPGPASAPGGDHSAVAVPPFRTGLTDEDLGLTADERQALE